jgi:integrase/recombinase XerD
MIKEDDKEAVFVNKEDYETILARIGMQWEDRITRLRNSLMIRLLYQWMFRVSELTHIREDDFNVSWKNVFLQILWKWKIIRSVAINPKVYEQIKEYISYRKSNNWYLFVSHANNSYWNKITRNSVEDIVKKYRNICGIKKKITPHSFRHGGATLMVSLWSPLNVVQKVLWHKHLTTTQNYLHVVDNEKTIYQSLLFD